MADRAVAEGDGEPGIRANPTTSSAQASAAPEQTPAPTASTGHHTDQELTKARERIAFYEGFDRLIQENIARSGDLLRQAAERRETAIQEVQQVRAESERRRADQRATLTLLAEEMLGLQQRVGELTRRIMVALDDLDASPTSTLPLPDLNSSLSSTHALDDPLPEPVSSVTESDLVATPEPATEHPISIAETRDPPETAAADASSLADQEGARPVSVVVHGLPRAAAALALQRHLAGLSSVDAVEAREFAAGVLRLEVFARGPLSLDDLRGWDGGAELQPMHMLPSVIEVALPETNI